jgi:hypothetical protein
LGGLDVHGPTGQRAQRGRTAEAGEVSLFLFLISF